MFVNMNECEGCKKLQGLYKSSWQLGFNQGKLTNQATLDQAMQALKAGQEAWNKEREEIQQLMTQAIMEAEDREDVWREKYYDAI